MPKAHVWNLRKTVREEFAVVLRDPVENPDFRAELRLRRHDSVSAVEYLSLAQEYTAMYVTGDGEPGTHGYTPPVHLPPVNGEPLTVSETTCRIICAVLTAQVQDEKYTFEELAAMCVSSAIGAQILEAGMNVAPKEPVPLDEEPNPTAKPTEDSSGSVSVGSDNTLRSSIGQTPSSGASTNGSAPSLAPTEGQSETVTA